MVSGPLVAAFQGCRIQVQGRTVLRRTWGGAGGGEASVASAGTNALGAHWESGSTRSPQGRHTAFFGTSIIQELHPIAQTPPSTPMHRDDDRMTQRLGL